MVILVLNCGSSSIKYQVLDVEAASHKLLAKGIVDRIGLAEGDIGIVGRGQQSHKGRATDPEVAGCHIGNITHAARKAANFLPGFLRNPGFPCQCPPY